MQGTQLFNEGLVLMGLGMGFVFVFLTVLVIVTTLMSKLIGRFFPEPTSGVATSTHAGSAPGRTTPPSDGDVIAVLSTAVHRYRQNHHR